MDTDALPRSAISRLLWFAAIGFAILGVLGSVILGIIFWMNAA